MRINSNLWSAGEQARSAEDRRSVKPESGKSRWFAAAVGAVAAGAIAFCGGSAYADSVTPPGEEACVMGSALPEGVYFINIYADGGYRGVDADKGTAHFDVPVIAWATPWQLNFLNFTGRFEVVAAAPAFLPAGIPCSNATKGTNNSPLHRQPAVGPGLLRHVSTIF